MKKAVCLLLFLLSLFGRDGWCFTASAKNSNVAKHVIKTQQQRYGDGWKSSPSSSSYGNQMQDYYSPSTFTSAGAASSSALFVRGGVTKAAAGDGVLAPVTNLLSKVWEKVLAVLAIIFAEFQQMTKIQKALLAAAFFTGLQFGKGGTFNLDRYTDANDVPSTYFGPNAPVLWGTCISVSDGDTFRFYHTPTPFHKPVWSKRGENKLSDVSMPIRICSYDTPETAKFGKKGQPFGEEAKEELKRLIDQKKISIRMLQKDQYGRAVAQVMLPVPGGVVGQIVSRLGRLVPFIGGTPKCVDEVMLKKGLAEVYLGMGAVYGPLGKDAYLKLEEKAKESKLGIWSLGNRESAAEYKKRTKE